MCVAALCVIACSECLCAPVEYLPKVSAALDKLEQGRTEDCITALKQALMANSNDPLAHVSLGFALLCGRRPDDALDEFGVALKFDKKCATAIYGKGLVHLYNKHLDYAAAAFKEAQAASPRFDTRGELAYIKAISEGNYAYAEGAEPGSLLYSMNAIWLMSQNRHSEAQAIWERMLKGCCTASYHEIPGSAITFLHSAPTIAAGSPLGKYSKSISVAKPKASVLTGVVNLKADLSRARSVKMVLFFIDDNLVGITNRWPFQYSWNTKEVANGYHTLKIQGSDQYTTVVSEKSARVYVQNEDKSAPSACVTGEEADKLWARLSRMTRLRISSAAINYNLAMCALKSGDKTTAKAALERTLAANPEYLDAGDRLSGLYRSTGMPASINSIKTSSKIIALTFDDGPKAKTTQLLDLLEKKNVKATFFIVGKQIVAEPEIFKRIVNDGHEVANHTFNHRDLEYLSGSDIVQEVFSNIAVIRSMTGKETRFFRPPGAHAGKKLPDILKKYGITDVFWTANCSPYEGTTAKKMADYVVSNAKPGGIILMHNVEGVTLNALPIIIDSLTAKGYKFVTLSAGG